jgi:release factor glutamine methyltransferase
VIHFGDLDIEFDERVFAPRPWTVHQSRWAVELLGDAPQGRILDLCSGVGSIGLLAASMSAQPLVSVDIDPVACDFARRNARAAGLGHQVEVREAAVELGTSPQERFKMVLADPPSVPTRKVARHPESPALAIDGGDDGLRVARLCLEAIRRQLDEDGSAVLQLGTLQQADVISGELAGGDLHVCEVRHRSGRGVLLHLRFASSLGR